MLRRGVCCVKTRHYWGSSGALGLVEGWEVVRETDDGILEDGELDSAIGGGTEAIEAQFPCCRREGSQRSLGRERDREREKYVGLLYIRRATAGGTRHEPFYYRRARTQLRTIVRLLTRALGAVAPESESRVSST